MFIEMRTMASLPTCGHLDWIMYVCPNHYHVISSGPGMTLYQGIPWLPCCTNEFTTYCVCRNIYKDTLDNRWYMSEYTLPVATF